MRMVNIVKGANLKKLSILVILLISVICLTFAFMPASAVSHAASSYSETPDATVFENGTKYRVPIGSRYMVYKSIDDEEYALFAIPETYYFTYRNSGKNGRNYISYNGISDGIYIKETSAMSLNAEKDVGTCEGYSCDVNVTKGTTFYVQSTVWMTNQIDNDSVITLIGFSDFITPEGTTLYNAAYVKVGTTYGFVDKSSLTKTDGSQVTDIPLHDNYKPQDVPDKTVETKAADPNKLTRIILIVGIVVPALVIVLLLFKPSKKGRYDYDRNSTMNDYGASPYDRPRSRYRDDYDDGRRRDDYRRDRRPDDDYDDGYYDNRRY